MWKRKEKERQEEFVQSLAKVFNTSLIRLIFNAWSNLAADTRRTREYFEVSIDLSFFLFEFSL